MRHCLHPRCSTLVEQGRCIEHARTTWSSTTGGTATQRTILGRTLQTARKRLFAKEPWCRLCAQQGRRSMATIRDHIVPLSEGGLDVESNTQPICDTCSRLKTGREALRGKRRAV